jgi:dUTPase
MFRVYGKVDNSYKNKFRSLLANISNMNNNVYLIQRILLIIFHKFLFS